MKQLSASRSLRPNEVPLCHWEEESHRTAATQEPKYTQAVLLDQSLPRFSSLDPISKVCNHWIHDEG